MRYRAGVELRVATAAERPTGPGVFGIRTTEAAVTFLRHNPQGQRLRARLEKRHGKGKALSILAHKIGRAVSSRLARETVFSMDKFLAA